MGLHKYRVGDYRVLLWVDREAGVLTLYGISTGVKCTISCVNSGIRMIRGENAHRENQWQQ